MWNVKCCWQHASSSWGVMRTECGARPLVSFPLLQNGSWCCKIWAWSLVHTRVSRKVGGPSVCAASWSMLRKLQVPLCFLRNYSSPPFPPTCRTCSVSSGSSKIPSISCKAPASHVLIGNSETPEPKPWTKLDTTQGACAVFKRRTRPRPEQMKLAPRGKPHVPHVRQKATEQTWRNKRMLTLVPSGHNVALNRALCKSFPLQAMSLLIEISPADSVSSCTALHALPLPVVASLCSNTSIFLSTYWRKLAHLIVFTYMKAYDHLSCNSAKKADSSRNLCSKGRASGFVKRFHFMVHSYVKIIAIVSACQPVSPTLFEVSNPNLASQLTNSRSRWPDPLASLNQVLLIIWLIQLCGLAQGKRTDLI